MAENIFRESTSGFEGKKILLEGLNKSCDIIGNTMGGQGQNNLFETFEGMPHITSDGWDSLEQLFWQDPIEAMALSILKEACKKTYENVGDSTSATCVLVQSFFKNSLEELEKGGNSIMMKSKIEDSVKKIVTHLESIAIPLTDELMYNVAKTSTHGDDFLAKTVQDAYLKAGEFGIVSHKRSFTDETHIEHISGIPIESGYSHEGFINIQETQSVIFDNPLVLCSLINFLTVNEITPFLDYASSTGRPLVIVSNMEQDIANVILSNVQSHSFPFVIIKPPYLGKKQRETMDDLALVLGSEVLSGITRTNYEGKELVYLGTCSRIEISKSDTVITACETVDSNPVKGRINELNDQIKHQTSEGEKNYLRQRISKLSGGISTIMVGGVTNSEVEERVARVDDAVKAVKSAKEEGVLAGGGVALLSALSLDLDTVTRNSITAPFKKIMENANCQNIEVGTYPMGYDVREFSDVNMIDSGIIDTLKGVKNALINAASASNNLLRSNNIITFKRQSNAK